VSRIRRRKRVRCKLACEIVVSAKKRVQGRIVTLSEGGIAVVTSLDLDQGDPIRIVIDPRGARPIRVSAIVWNDTMARVSGAETRLQRLGCVISEPSDTFVALLDRLLPPDPEILSSRPVGGTSESIPIAVPKARAPQDDWAETDLPRSRDLQPPPKVDPEESLPYFRIRLKQIGGPRTRIMTIQARSASQAERRALERLDSIATGAEGWGVLHVAKMTGGAR
jgi:hypothetical protein